MMKLHGKIFLCVICLSFFFSCTAQTNNEPALAADKFVSKPGNKERIAELNNSVFCISIVVKGTVRRKFSVGTAFLVGRGLLASALHVQTKAGRARTAVRQQKSRSYRLENVSNGRIHSVSSRAFCFR